MDDQVNPSSCKSSSAIKFKRTERSKGISNDQLMTSCCNELRMLSICNHRYIAGVRSYLRSLVGRAPIARQDP